MKKLETPDVRKQRTGLVENRQAKIGGLKLSILVNGIKEKVFGLEVPMHDSKRVTGLDNLDDGLDEGSGLPLAVVALLHDPIEELPTLAQLHDQVHRRGVLVGPFYANHVRVLRQVVHYLNLPPHILVVLLAQKLPLRNRLARKLPPTRSPRAQKRRSELPLP
ncbi:hypothetical protein CR513_40771, partial [Mucuna pruriens]